jgi:hypothetical protein
MATPGNAEHEDIAAAMTLIDDVRSDLIEEVKQAWKHTEQRFDGLWTLLSNPPENPAVPLLEEVIKLLRPAQVRRPWWHPWRWPAAVLLAGVVGLGGGWWTWGEASTTRTWATIGQRVDGVLVEQYLGLSKSAQDAITSLYRQLGLTSPGERKGKRA